MKINILYLPEWAKQAKWLTVIIDVFRAFSTECYIFANGAKSIIPVWKLDIAYKLKRENTGFILVWERWGEKPDGFDYGNSPSKVEFVNFTWKTIIHTTSSGTQGIANATHANEIITGSFTNAQAIVDYIRQQSPKYVSLIAMWSWWKRITDEDKLCAEYIKNTLEGKPTDFWKIVKYLRNYKEAEKFFDDTLERAPERDFELCLSLNKFNFVLKAKPYKDGEIFLKKIEMA